MASRHLGLFLPVFALVGCGVAQEKYDTAVRDAHDAKAQSQTCEHLLRKTQNDLSDTASKLTRANADLSSNGKDLSEAKRQQQYLQVRLDGATAETSELRKELAKLGKNADTLLAERGVLSSSLADAKARLEELRRAEAAAQSRAALFKQLAIRFQKMIDAGRLSVALREGRMVLQLPNDVLFDSGQTVIKRDGRSALTEVAAGLQSIPGRHFQIAGNTDDVPIANARFASNWELSTARALEVVRFLIGQGVAPSALSASGYGEFDPVVPNDSDAGRRRNRRIEIVLQPNIDEFVAVPEQN